MNEENLYDKYNFGLDGLNIQMVEFMDDYSRDNQKILKDVKVGVTIKNCLEPLHPELPTLKVDISCPKPISIEICDTLDLALRIIRMTQFLMRLIENEDIKTLEFNEIQKYQENQRAL